MSDISNFARQDTVSVVEFADYLRECLPPVRWPEAEAECGAWRKRLPYSLVLKFFYPHRFCRTPVPAHIRRVFRQMPPTAVRLPCLFRTAAALPQRPLVRPPTGKGLLRFQLLRKVVCRRRSLPPLSSLRTRNRILRKLRLKRPSETPLSPNTQSPPSRRFQTAKQRETQRFMVKSVSFSVSSVIHF